MKSLILEFFILDIDIKAAVRFFLYFQKAIIHDQHLKKSLPACHFKFRSNSHFSLPLNPCLPTFGRITMAYVEDELSDGKKD